MKFWLRVQTEVEFYDTNTSGGTVNKYKAVARGGETRTFVPAAPWVNVIEGATVPLPEGVVIAEYSRFMGKETGVTFYMNPADAPLMLTA